MKTKSYVPSELELVCALMSSALRLQMVCGKDQMYMFVSPLMAIELELNDVDFVYNVDVNLSGFTCFARCLN